VDAHLLEELSAKFHADPTGNYGAIGFLRSRADKKKNMNTQQEEEDE